MEPDLGEFKPFLKMPTQPRRLAAAVAAVAGRLLFPPTCIGCRRIVAEPGALCAHCWPALRFIEEPFCPVMGTPFQYDMGEGFLSLEAIAFPPHFDRARAAVLYDGAARQLVRGLKYGDRTDLAPWMAGWMLRPGSELLREADMLVPVPLHWRRFLSRRFNQSAELGRAIARRSDVVFAPEVLVRRKKTKQQVGLRRKAREDNVRSAFAVPERFKARIRGKRMLVVDDVYTTGATVGAAARALKRAGAAHVDVLTFARVVPETADLDGDFLPDEGMHI